jgi:acetyl esterase
MDFDRRTFVKLAGATAGASIIGGPASAQEGSDDDDFRRAAELDPQVEELLDILEEEDAPDINELSTEEARPFFEEFAISETDANDPRPVGDVENRTISGPGGEIPIRIYTPEDEGPHPALVYFHSGGWVLGDLDTHDSNARALSNKADAVVVSVDYRKGPEEPFPAAVEDAICATRWVSNESEKIDVDSDRIAVGGDSAGGNLSTVVSLEARERDDISLVHQLLIYPVTDNSANDLRSHEQNAEGFFLTTEDLEWFGERYLENEIDGQNIYASPALARDLSDLPPATIITAGYDPLRDEGFNYAELLEEDGVEVELTNFEDMIHDFLIMRHLDDPYPDIERAEDGFDEAAAALRSAFDT